MTEPIQNSSSTISYVFVVGGNEPLFRELKRNLLKEGVNISGHAQPHWHAPFDIRSLTTHVLVISDDCTPKLRECGEAHAIRMKIPVISIPAKATWPTSWENILSALKKHGAFEKVPIIENNIDKPTMGEILKAKGQELKLPDAPSPSTATVVNLKGKPHAEMAALILADTGGLLGNDAIAEYITTQSGVKCSTEFVKNIRRMKKMKPAPRGSKSQKVIDLLAKYKVFAPSKIIQYPGGRPVAGTGKSAILSTKKKGTKPAAKAQKKVASHPPLRKVNKKATLPKPRPTTAEGNANSMPTREENAIRLMSETPPRSTPPFLRDVDLRPSGGWSMTYPVGGGESITVTKTTRPTLKQLRMLIKGLEHHLAIEAEDVTDEE